MSESIPNFDDVMIRDRMESRRTMMLKQNLANENKSKLCDLANNAKPPHLDTIIRAFESENPALYNYISYLEKIEYGVWCHTCNEPKNIDVLKVHGVENNIDRSDNTERLDKLQVLLEAVGFKVREYSHCLEQQDEGLLALCAKINMAKKEIDKLRAGSAGLKSADLLA